MAKARSAALGASGKAARAGFAPPTRIQTSLLSSLERAALTALCRAMPAWVTPDRLTAAGAAGAAITALGYIGSNWRPAWLFLASFGILVNWFGDSLDGSLARHRRIERPRYGYFLDHSVDGLNHLVFALGLGLTPYVSMAAALALLASYNLLMVYVLITAQVRREFPLAKAFVGPTELRLIAIAFNFVLYAFGPVSVDFAGFSVSLWSALVVFEAVAFVAVYIVEVGSAAWKLRCEDGERPGR